MHKKLVSGKFLLGIGLILLSFVVAQVARIVFFLYFTDPSYRNWSIAAYTLSWLVFPVGIWLVGREYYGAMKRYTSLKHYYETVMNRTKRADETAPEKQSSDPRA